MSLAPVLTDVGGAVGETTFVVTKSVSCGGQLQFTVTASDPEGDSPTYNAFMLRDGMTFAAGTRAFTYIPPDTACGKTYYVKFHVATNTWPKASGGTDAVICKIVVGGGLAPGPETAAAVAAAVPDGPNPTRGAFALTSPAINGVASLLHS